MNENFRSILIVILGALVLALWYADDRADQADRAYMEQVEQDVIEWGEELETVIDEHSEAITFIEENARFKRR